MNQLGISIFFKRLFILSALIAPAFANAEITDENDMIKADAIIEVNDAIDINDVLDVENDIDALNLINANRKVKAKKVSNVELPDGSVYSGDLKYDVLREGVGVNEWPNGDRYSGEWLNDNPHGNGVLIHKNKDEYHGLFAFGQYSGLGDLKTASTERYLGNFRYNKLDGLGVFVSVNKSYYLGEFSQQKRHGRFLYFSGISAKPEYQIWIDDHLDKTINTDTSDDIQDIEERELITQMVASFTVIGIERLKERQSNTHYQIRGRVRKIVSDVDDSPAHAYGDLLINLLNLND